MDIGKIIKEERTKRNLTQEQLAQEFFVTRQLISKWENGKSYPDLDQVVKLSSYFELTLDYLLKEDQQMVQELNLTTHRKRIGLVLIAILTILSISLSTILLAAFWIDPVFFTKEDLTITSIKKYRLPATEISNEATGQVIQLPEDTEYLITYTIDRPLVKTVRLSGYKEYSSENASQLTALGHRGFHFGAQTSKIVIRSNREDNLAAPELNAGKDLYLRNMNKARVYQKSAAGVAFSIEDEGDLLFTAEELAQLPFEQGQLPE